MTTIDQQIRFSVSPAFATPRHTVSCIGDSLTDNAATRGVATHLMWPERLALRLRSGSGASVKARNFGISGQRSNHMINRLNVLTQYETPEIAMMWTGTNDVPLPTWSATGGSITATTGQFVGIIVIWHVTAGTGIDLVSQPVALPVTTTTTGSITVPAIAFAPLNEVNYDIYTTPVQATALAAIQLARSSYLNAGTSASVSSGAITATTITALGAGAALSTVQGVTAFTTQQCLQAFARAIKFQCAGAWPYVQPSNGVALYNQSQLPAGNFFGCRFVVMNDTSTTGGAAATQGGQAATITGTSSGITVWEWRYAISGEGSAGAGSGPGGWGRIAIISTPSTNALTKIFVPSMHYLNWSSGGDTTGTAYQPYDAVTGIRAQQIAAVNAEARYDGGQTQYIDIYNTFRTRILAGQDAAGYNANTSWHVADLDVHRNAYGEDLVSIAILGSATTAGSVLGTPGLLASLIA